MTFPGAVSQLQPPANSACQAGLQALGSNSRLVKCSNTRKITGSINVDAALASVHPDEPRWDYGIGFKRASHEEAIWIEVHPAATSEVGKMIAKLRWLQRWLANNAPALDSITCRAHQPFVWIATRGIHIPLTTPQARQLATSGLRFPVKQLPLR